MACITSCAAIGILTSTTGLLVDHCHLYFVGVSAMLSVSRGDVPFKCWVFASIATTRLLLWSFRWPSAMPDMSCFLFISECDLFLMIVKCAITNGNLLCFHWWNFVLLSLVEICCAVNMAC